VSNSLIQPSFTGGELSPSLYGRVDLARYNNSLKTCRNFIAQQYGGAKNRAGTRFIFEVKDSSKRCRLIPFEFSTTQTYVLEFGNLYMRAHSNGAVVESSPGVPFEVATPYTTADLPALNWTQSADVLTIVHPSYQPRQISRTSATNFTVTLFPNVNGPFRDINVVTTTTVYSSATTGAVTLTASAALFDASMIGTPFYIEQKDYGTPWEPGKPVVLNDIRRSDGKYYLATNAGTTGSLRPTHFADDWSDGAVVWRFLHPGFGVCTITAVASAFLASATVVDRIPDGSVGAPGATYKWAKAAWGGTQGYPSATSFYQNRQLFGGASATPQANWMSKVGNYFDFGSSQPLASDDAIAFPIPGRQVNAVRHYVPLNRLAILTSGSEWVVGAGQSDIITPDTISLKPQGYRGSSQIPPLVVGNTVLYVQDKGKTIRELAYDFTSDTYTGQDVTQLASHLFANFTLSEWCYQQVPFQVVWSVRSDGTLLGLTYLKEQQVVGWHRHDTDGQFESAACVSEGSEDVLYVIVKRTINGVTRRYVEKLNTRTFATQADEFFVDAGLSYDGRNTSAKTMTISGGTTWSFKADVFTLTASSASFLITDIGAEIHFPVGDQVIRLAITGYTSATVVTAQANRDIPVSLRAVATTAWKFARKSFAGLTHLEGKLCNVLADGAVHPQVTVAGGAVALQYAAAVVHVGLPITADFETLSLSIPGQETPLDKKKLIQAVRLLVEDTRGLSVGPDPAHLTEFKQRASENYDVVTANTTGLYEGRIQAKWDKYGNVFVRQTDPLPATILAYIPEVTVGGT
jgi:hypothetical protein